TDGEKRGAARASRLLPALPPLVRPQTPNPRPLPWQVRTEPYFVLHRLEALRDARKKFCTIEPNPPCPVNNLQISQSHGKTQFRTIHPRRTTPTGPSPQPRGLSRTVAGDRRIADVLQPLRLQPSETKQFCTNDPIDPALSAS